MLIALTQFKTGFLLRITVNERLLIYLYKMDGYMEGIRGEFEDTTLNKENS